MTINLEEVLTNHLSLRDRHKYLEASIEMTKAIRDVYFNSPELVETELFKLMVLSERKEIERINRGVGYRYGVHYRDSLLEHGNIALSNLNTLLLIKMKKAGMIDELSKDPKVLVQEETSYLVRGLDTILERSANALYHEEGIVLQNEAEFIARNLSINFPRFKDLERHLNDRTYLLDCEQFALNEIDQYYQLNPDSEQLKWHSRVLLSLVLINWGMGYEVERNYLLLKLKDLINERSNFYWLVQFLCKELI